MNLFAAFLTAGGFGPAVQSYAQVPRYIVRMSDGAHFYFDHKSGQYVDHETGDVLSNSNVGMILDDLNPHNNFYAKSLELVHRVDGASVLPPDTTLEKEFGAEVASSEMALNP